MSTLKLFEMDKYLNGSPEMPSNDYSANLSERLFSNKLVTTCLSLRSIACNGLVLRSRAVNTILPCGRVVTSTY